MKAPRATSWCVMTVVVASAIGHRHLLRVVSWPNDLGLHETMVSWASSRFQHGEVPFDGWMSTLSGGLPQFHHYQSLPHLLTGWLGAAIGPGHAVHVTLWLLVCTWPVAVYLGGRAMGLDPWAAAASAVVAPLIRSATGYGFESFSYLWLGNGLWSQAWGMWTAPLALGWSARLLRTGEGGARAVIAVALTLAFHLPTGWFVLVVIPLLVLAEPSRWRTTAPRAALVLVGAAVASLWVTLPFLADRWAGNASSFNSQGSFADSFGWRRVLGWVLAGDLLDAGRIPILSALAAVGLYLVISRWRTGGIGARQLVVVFAASLVLFIGRDPFGLLLALIPGSSQVFLHRYVATLQLALVWLSGLGCQHLARWCAGHFAATRLGPVRAAAACVAVGVLLVPALRSSHRLLEQDRSWVQAQAVADRTVGRDAEALLAIAERRGGGRVWAGSVNAGPAMWIGSVSGPIWLAHQHADAMGFSLRVSALAADLEASVDPHARADLEALGVRYVLSAKGASPMPGAKLLAVKGDFELRELGGRYLSGAVLQGPALEVDNTSLAATLLPAMRAGASTPGRAQVVVMDGRSPAVPDGTTTAGSAPTAAVQVRDHEVDLEGGHVAADVTSTGRGALVVRANWHPRWQATVDGKPAKVLMVAPTFMAVAVPPGTHHVELRYQPWRWTPVLLVLGCAGVVAAAWCLRRPRQRRTSREGGTP